MEHSDLQGEEAVGFEEGMVKSLFEVLRLSLTVENERSHLISRHTLGANDAQHLLELVVVPGLPFSDEDQLLTGGRQSFGSGNEGEQTSLGEFSRRVLNRSEQGDHFGLMLIG